MNIIIFAIIITIILTNTIIKGLFLIGYKNDMTTMREERKQEMTIMREERRAERKEDMTIMEGRYNLTTVISTLALLLAFLTKASSVEKDNKQ